MSIQTSASPPLSLAGLSGNMEDESCRHCGHVNNVASTCEAKVSPYEFHSSNVVQSMIEQSTSSTPNRLLEASDLLAQIAPFFWISAKHRSLLAHFIQYASQASTCSAIAQKRFNQLIIPKALRSPSLLKSILAWSAGHRSLQCELLEEKPRLEIIHSELVESTLQSLQMEIRDPQKANQVPLIAASLMLCLQKLCQERLDPKSWRVHLEGAKVIMSAASRSNHDDPDDLELLKVLNRWYQAIEALAALTARGLPTGQVSFTQQSAVIAVSGAEGEYIDEYCGYTFKLNEKLREIGAAAWERRTRSQAAVLHVELSSEDFDAEADFLQDSVLCMVAKDRLSPTFYPGVANNLSPTEIHDFVLCNEAYQHMALIHVQRRVKRLARSSPSVQGSVKRILECGNLVRKNTTQPSPWIALTGPLFTAGCDAVDEDKHFATVLLQALYKSTRSESTQRALSILESFWEDNQGFDYYDWEMLPGVLWKNAYIEYIEETHLRHPLAMDHRTQGSNR